MTSVASGGGFNKSGCSLRLDRLAVSGTNEILAWLQPSRVTRLTIQFRARISSSYARTVVSECEMQQPSLRVEYPAGGLTPRIRATEDVKFNELAVHRFGQRCTYQWAEELGVLVGKNAHCCGRVIWQHLNLYATNTCVSNMGLMNIGWAALNHESSTLWRDTAPRGPSAKIVSTTLGEWRRHSRAGTLHSRGLEN